MRILPDIYTYFKNDVVSLVGCFLDFIYLSSQKHPPHYLHRNFLRAYYPGSAYLEGNRPQTTRVRKAQVIVLREM